MSPGTKKSFIQSAGKYFEVLAAA